jgi:hypothetical protein
MRWGWDWRLELRMVEKNGGEMERGENGWGDVVVKGNGWETVGENGWIL